MKSFLNNRYIPYIISFVLLILLLEECSNARRFSSNNEALQDSVRTYRLSNKQLASEKKALIVTEKELRKGVFIKDDSLKSLLKKFKEPQIGTIIKTITVIDSVKIPIKENRFIEVNPNFSINGRISEDFIVIDKFKINNTQRIVTGIKKGWFKNELVTTVTNSNPLIETKEIITQTVKIPNKRFSIGVFAGANYLGRPTIGIGLTYALFQF
jgi:hypothetical protein